MNCNKDLTISLKQTRPTSYLNKRLAMLSDYHDKSEMDSFVFNMQICVVCDLEVARCLQGGLPLWS